ncbi:MAG: carboxypeptidase-like regulatory domain-containing protein, partial [Planctomycetes bacterium]|nr:carboxypeptidase-like regulatory domain-containing protein [Planctomycetota bacterium]
ATGRVLSTDGTPIEGALVATTGSGAFGLMDPRTARTDAGGRFTLPSVQPLVQPLIFVAMAPGHGRVLYRVEAAGPVDLGDIRLPHARTLSGRVLGPGGEPVPRVRVDLRGSNDDKDRLLAAPPERDIGIWWGNVESRLADDLGRFRFHDLAPGTYEVAVRPEEGPAVIREVAVAGDTDVELRLEYEHELTVRVVDGQGLPVPGARLHVLYGRERLWKTADEQGIAIVALPSPATRIGLLAGIDWDGFLPSPPIDLSPDAREVTLTARRAVIVAGRVVDKAGNPVPEVPIAWVCAGEQLGISVSAGDGSFRAKVPLGGAADLIVLTETLAGELRGVVGGSEGVTLVVRPR